MKSMGLRQYIDVLFVTLAVFILDILLYSYFLQTNANYSNALIFVDVVIVLLALVFGRKVANRLEFPIWQVSYIVGMSKRSIIISILIGVGIVSTNTIILCNYDIDMIPWLRFNNIYQPLLLAIRAALTEEIVFRLLIFSLICKFTNDISKSSTICFISGALFSAIAFGLPHSGFYLAFIFGIGLCYIYKNNGLISAMMIHFLADFIPFTLIYLK